MMNRPHLPACLCVAVVLMSGSAARAQAPTLDTDRIREFLRSAEVIAAERTATGVTQPWRLTLSDGTLTHDAAFQSIDERKAVQRLGQRLERNFVDSYRYNIAAYRLAELLGLAEMIPVTVERRWNGTVGALSWWIDDVMFDEAARIAERRRPDDVAAWSAQMGRMQVFGELVQDTDRNMTNMLYTRDWQVYMIDFTRAFRTRDELQRPADLVRIDRQLFERLRTLTPAEAKQATEPHLTDDELAGLIKRRDRLVEHFRRLIDQKGEPGVFN